MALSDAEVASMLASANSQAGTQAVASVEPDGTVNPNIIIGDNKENNVNQPDGDGIIRAQKAVQPTPEEAIALMDKVEGKEVTPTGEVADPTKEVTPPVVKEEVDITKLPKEEQIRLLQAQIDEENGVIPQPLKEVEDKAIEAGLDLSDLSKQYVEDGSLSEDTMKSLEKAGFDKTAVDAYIATKVASETAKSNKAITDTCGSQENFDEMSKWMSESLTEAELKTYNEGVQGEHYKVYLENMYSKFTGTKAPEVRTVRQQGVTTAHQSNTFASTGEMMKAMQDPRYARDINYRNTVIAKVGRMK